MLTAVISGLICGIRGYEALVQWVHSLPLEYIHAIGYFRRPPQKDCFRDLLMKLDPMVLEDVLSRWVSEHLELQIDPADVAAVRHGRFVAVERMFDVETRIGRDEGSRDFIQRSPHRSSMFNPSLRRHEPRKGHQCRVPNGTNEHKAALELLKNVVLKERLVVGDAAYCQRDLCEQIIEQEGDYLFAVKGDQPELLQEITLEFAAADAAFSPLVTVEM